MQRSDTKRNTPSPQQRGESMQTLTGGDNPAAAVYDTYSTTVSNKTPPPRTIPTRHLDRQWSACSLCSVDSIDALDNEVLPIPGRESHTSDMNQFLTYIHRLNHIRRFEGDAPLNLEFWKYIKSVLETASKPVGYMGLTDCDAVEPKSAQDNATFLKKIETTSIINPMDPSLLAERLNMPVEDILTELLYAAKIDMVRMRWFPNCDYLPADPCASKRPRRKKAAYCNACKYRNAIVVLKKIKVVFLFNTDIFFALAEMAENRLNLDEENDLLAVAPASFTGSGYRYSVGCGNTSDGMMLRPALSPGRYKITCPIAMTSSFLQIERACTDEDEPYVLRIHVSDILHRTGRNRKTLKAPHGKIYFDIFTDTHPFFICKMNKVEDDPGGSSLLDSMNNDILPPERRRAFTSAQTVMDTSAYLNLFESTEDETFHFNSAVKKMSLDASASDSGVSDLISPLKGLNFGDEIASVAEDA